MFSSRVVLCRRLEADIKRLKSDLQSSRQTEQELRSQINTLLTGDRQTKGEMQQLQHDNDQLQSKLVSHLKNVCWSTIFMLTFSSD